jgi:hypothetical protein
MKTSMHSIAMQAASLLVSGVGFATFTLAIHDRGYAAVQPALGVFMMFIGFNGLYSLRFAQLQDRIGKLEESAATPRRAGPQSPDSSAAPNTGR